MTYAYDNRAFSFLSIYCAFLLLQFCITINNVIFVESLVSFKNRNIPAIDYSFLIPQPKNASDLAIIVQKAKQIYQESQFFDEPKEPQLKGEIEKYELIRFK